MNKKVYKIRDTSLRVCSFSCFFASDLNSYIFCGRGQRVVVMDSLPVQEGPDGPVYMNPLHISTEARGNMQKQSRMLRTSVQRVQRCVPNHRRQRHVVLDQRSTSFNP